MTVEDFRIEHEARQAGVPEGSICLHDGVTIRTVPESRFGFEFFCWRSPQMVLEMRAFLRHAAGKQRFVDVGALHGVFSLAFLALNHHGAAFAYEPHPGSYEVLRQNVAETPGVCASCVGISEKDSEVIMGEEFGCHFVASAAGSLVKCISAGEMCLSLKPDIIKIDVEGHEQRVLLGMGCYLREFRPTILLEIHPVMMERIGDSAKDVFTILQNAGYQEAEDTLTSLPVSFEELLTRREDSRIILS